MARRLCFLYLNRDVQVNEIYLDDLFLEVPNKQRTAWKWSAGINYFSAQRDQRWWNDHRIPAGIAVSVSSVGHMVKSRRLVDSLTYLEQMLELVSGDVKNHRIDSLEKTLEMAMRTIDKASERFLARPQGSLCCHLVTSRLLAVPFTFLQGWS